MKEEFNRLKNPRRNIICYNCDRIGHYTNECIQSLSKSKYNPDFYCMNCNRQGYTRKFYTRRKTVNYFEKSDLKEEINLITRLEKSYNIKNFNNFAKNKDKDNRKKIKIKITKKFKN